MSSTELLSVIAGIICSRREVSVEEAVKIATEIIVEASSKAGGLQELWVNKTLCRA